MKSSFARVVFVLVVVVLQIEILREVPRRSSRAVVGVGLGGVVRQSEDAFERSFFQFLYFFFLFLSDHISHAMRYSSTSRDSLLQSRALIIPWDEERIHILNAR